MTPSWGELFERIGWLAYGWYRQRRKAWRRWRVARRQAKRIRDFYTPGVPIYFDSFIEATASHRIALGDFYADQARSLQNAAHALSQQQLQGLMNMNDIGNPLAQLRASALSGQAAPDLLRQLMGGPGASGNPPT